MFVWAALLSSVFFVACLDQYNPLPYWQKFQAEQQIAHKAILALKENGTLPDKPVPVIVVTPPTGSVLPVEEKYNTFCASCHGLDGKAQTPAGLAAKSRNFTEKEWQDKVTDQHIEDVIMKGGAAMGLSPMMAPWGALLPGDLPKEMVKKIRSFKGQ
jgi:hypothetical protein